MTCFRALLVGLGQIGCGYDAALPFILNQPNSTSHTLTHARALACHPGFVLEAGIDPNPGARNRFTKLYGVPSYADLSSWWIASRDSPPDLVVIAVAPQLQSTLVQELLSLCVPQLLLLEKPVASSLEEGMALKNACNRHPQMHVAVNYIRRWLPSVQFWQKRLQKGELGQFLHGQLTYGKGLLSNGSHLVNLAEAWLGPLILGGVIDRGVPFLTFDREANLELLAVDHIQAPLQLRSVGSAGLRAAELDLWFEGGRLSWLNNGQSIALWQRIDQLSGEVDSHDRLSAYPELSSTGIDHYQLQVVNALYKHLQDSDTSRLSCDLKDGLRTLETLAPVCT